MKLGLTFLCLILPCSFGFPHYQWIIPNGHRVPNPCEPSRTWDGVGHFMKFGGGARNPFGLDFANHGHVCNTYFLFCLDPTGKEGSVRFVVCLLSANRSII